MFTGGDSAFAARSGWVYAPCLVALGLTLAAVIATALAEVVPAAVLIVASVAMYAITWVVWDPYGVP